ncbi:MAG: TonB-dependent receptor, partial [Calditrichaceae bacterium]
MIGFLTMMRSFLLAIGFLLIAGFPLHAEDTFFVRDIWTDQPIPQAQVTISDSVVFTDDYGVFRTDISLTDSMRINIAKTGYFDIAFTLSMLNSPVIYLTPVENTASIICIRPQITDTPLQLPSSTSYILIDQADQISNKNIADVLAGQTGIFMKSYGPGGSLQSISVRGMSPEQTQILFDGIPMNSLQLGTVDMGLYGLNNIGSLEIYRGGNALFGGSGSIGGSIDINPAPLFKEFNYKISGSVNSLSGFNFDGSIDLPFRNYRQRIFFSRAKAENKFKTKYNDKEVSLKNRDYQQISYGYQNAYNFTRDFYIKGYFSGYQREGGSPGPF